MGKKGRERSGGGGGREAIVWGASIASAAGVIEKLSSGIVLFYLFIFLFFVFLFFIFYILYLYFFIFRPPQWRAERRNVPADFLLRGAACLPNRKQPEPGANPPNLLLVRRG